MSFRHTQAVSVIHPVGKPREFAVGLSTIKGMGGIRETNLKDFMLAVAGKINELRPDTEKVLFAPEEGVSLRSGNAVVFKEAVNGRDKTRKAEIITIPRAQLTADF